MSGMCGRWCARVVPANELVTIAMVSNSQMQDAIKLAPAFEAENPGIDLKFVSLSENTGARQDHGVDGNRRR